MNLLFNLPAMSLAMAFSITNVAQAETVNTSRPNIKQGIVSGPSNTDG
jgi:hypothetical protein